MLKAEWTEPQKMWTSGGIVWKRSWILPDDQKVKTAFWLFYNKNKLMLKLKGFSAKKDKNNIWIIEQTVNNKRDFEDLGKTQTTEDYSKIDYTVSNLPPYTIKDKKVKSILYDWQIPITEKVCSSIKTHGSAINGSEMGSGKTYMTISVAKEFGYKIGVVCPKSVISSWKKAIEKDFGMKKDISFVINYESLRTGKYKEIGTWVVPKGKKKKVFTWKCSKDTLIVFDESHKLKNKKTQNSEIAVEAKKQGYKILLCSGTAAISPLELYASGYILGLHVLKDYYPWIYKHGCYKGNFGLEFNGDEFVLKKLHKDLFLDKGVRIKKEDIKGFPDCETIVDTFDLDSESEKKINQIYKDMQREIALLKAKQKKDSTAEMVVRLRARQQAELVKVPLLVDLTEECIEQGQSVVIIVNFSETIKALSKRLNSTCIVWGENKDGERDKNIKSFQDDKSRVIILNIQAGGVGVSLHDLNGKYPRVSLISPNDSAVLLRQALGRIHRAGAKTKALQKVIYIANTIEEEVCKNVKSKIKNLDLINDGDLSVDREI